jgi:argininosuccinate lyase
MSDTGRLSGQLGRRTQRLVYGELSPAEREAELALMTEVDRAHLLMLKETGLISAKSARALLVYLDELRDENFHSLRMLPAPRGVFLMYESHLMERLGPDIGGVLHTGRSRNDLKATMTQLRLRDWTQQFLAEVARLQAVLLSRARAHRSVVMPIHTHFQAAMPTTYGHYLLGVACALGRDADAVEFAAGALGTCPLGASAVIGTDLPIDPERTADLLGFTAGPLHAVDAVASRDVMLRIVGAAAGLAVTLSRLATDMQLWSSAEFRFLAFPDRLVGGSSAMPQKRNAFLLEHVKAKAGGAIGAWTAAAACMKSAPFTNSIEVGTEAVGNAWQGLAQVLDAVLMTQVLVSGATPVEEQMRRAAEEGFVTATALANRWVRQGVPFREAHRMVGRAVREAIAAGRTDLGEPDLDLESVVDAHVHGGGPGAFDRTAHVVAADWSARTKRVREWTSATEAARERLATEVRRVMEENQDEL